MHGNCVALDAILPDLNQNDIDRVVCLGDAIQGGPQPAEVVERLRTLACPVVMGNADAWVLTGKESGAEDIPQERLRQMNEVRDWTLAQLSVDDLSFISAFRPTVELPLANARQLLCFHGSPRSFDDVILPTTSEADFQAMLGAYDAYVLAGGHTHMQQIRRLGSTDSIYINPGSVGLAYSHQQEDNSFRADGWAEYAVLTSVGEQMMLEFRRVPFDVPELIDKYRAGGRPHAEAAIAQYRTH
jgi:predicted phosphodiesterase